MSSRRLEDVKVLRVALRLRLGVKIIYSLCFVLRVILFERHRPLTHRPRFLYQITEDGDIYGTEKQMS